MSESADWARTLVMHIIKAIEPTAKCLNIRFDFIVGWFLVVLHTGTLGRTRYEDASHLLRFCDKGRTSQALPGTLDTVLLQKRREFATSARHLCSQMKLKILIVDDDIEFAQLLEFNLERRGCETRIAYQGMDGLRLARTESPDLILLIRSQTVPMPAATACAKGHHRNP